jgi:hypothetical protein
MIILQLLVCFAAATTATYCLGAINRMTAKTHHGVRAAYVLIAAGAVGEILAILEGHVPGIAESLFLIGCGMLDFVDRRAVVRRALITERQFNEH